MMFLFVRQQANSSAVDPFAGTRRIARYAHLLVGEVRNNASDLSNNRVPIRPESVPDLKMALARSPFL